MARKKISEHKAKTILFDYLKKDYTGYKITPDNINSKIKLLGDNLRYVFKVDQGVKKRFKQGLIGVDISKNEIKKYAEQFKSKGFTNYILEELVPHVQIEEKYLSLERTREGIKMFYSSTGGVDIEENQDSIQSYLIDSNTDINKIAILINLDSEFLNLLVKTFENEYFAFLEINPLVIKEGEIYILDMAVEVDSSGEFFVESWSEEDLISENLNDVKTKYEIEIDKLSEKSPSSFRLNVLNENGSIFMLLSGGGASIAAADEAYQLGYKEEIANYGEYSGNPNSEETYIYTKNIIEMLINSKAKKKVIIIAGGVANFTDVYKTFKGLIKALNQYKEELKKAGVKVFVRRGGPNEDKGLKLMKDFLEVNNLLGKVTGSEYIMTDIISDAVKFLNK